MTDPPFSAPRKTCRWAAEEISNFQAAEKTFLEQNPGFEWWKHYVSTGIVAHGIIFPEKPSDVLERGAYRIVNDLRNALDQAVFAAVVISRPTRTGKPYFPFGETEKDFWSTLKSPKGAYRDVPSELHDILGSFEPFWTTEGNNKGDDVLRGLGFMANPNKHQIPLGIGVNMQMRFYGATNIISVGTLWDGDRKTELYRSWLGVPYQFEHQIEPRIALGEVGRLRGKPATATFRAMHAVVERIINGLEAEANRLIGR